MILINITKLLFNAWVWAFLRCLRKGVQTFAIVWNDLRLCVLYSPLILIGSDRRRVLCETLKHLACGPSLHLSWFVYSCLQGEVEKVMSKLQLICHFTSLYIAAWHWCFTFNRSWCPVTWLPSSWRPHAPPPPSLMEYQSFIHCFSFFLFLYQCKVSLVLIALLHDWSWQ